MTQTVTVRHEPASASAAALVAALNAVALDASLSPPRAQPRGSAPWLPPTHLLVAAALLIVSLFQYLDGPTGGHSPRLALDVYNISLVVF